ncbi:MAG: TAXI family TRAP transporter solute-binding subunit [Gomphosphaeria aponina SAG 52.96 = DSM 107014]|uniref:TAXI family TRAP transporter solute-binding subunit n=1 Tax=Gomphosphaeria aponina SAG 52.96 = DSM 107014 TaxID=1521640 RepID=A0A941JSR5_9CHRO|nr:TAXI family TRAP transporter solute-binding subunit [Gomphosphaeria aponina SAG 52.96 = DSM 107014]
MKKRLYYLMCGILGVMVLLLIFIPSHTRAQTAPQEINIVTGSEAGEYYAIARDLEEFALQSNLDLDIDVIPTRGSLQNIHDVFEYKSVPLGIAQSDVLAFLNTFANNDEEVRRQAEALRVVLPLYDEQVHLITRGDINSVEELSGKRISISSSGSGTSLTATTLMYQLEINPGELLTLEVKKAIEALRQEEIDAMFYVVGIPAKVLIEEITPEDNFQILPIALPPQPDDEFLSRLYTQATLSAETYPWQKESVETLAVKSLLFTVVEEECENVTPVANLIQENLSWLQENGDPVWKGVNRENLSQIEAERVSQCSAF